MRKFLILIDMTPNNSAKATRLALWDFKSLPIRTFWITSAAFFLCFFAWFGIVPFMPDVVRDLGLTPAQKWNSIILAVSGTVFARILIGRLCDRFGPRLCYTWLLIAGALPVMLIGLAQTPLQFLICRFLTGFIGASFVITQFHTSIMFAPNVVGTANATSAGWGNLGGGANRLGMPLIAAAVVSFGIADEVAWRYSMFIAGFVCLLMGLVYFIYTKDTPEGNFKELKERGDMPRLARDEVSLAGALRDYRVWILFIVYAACFGMELTVYGTMDDYLQNTFGLTRETAGNLVLSFALMNIFARTLGGFFGDRFGNTRGLHGRVYFLALILMAEGMMLTCFSLVSSLAAGIFFLVAFSLTVQMAEGATFSVVPFINKKAIGAVSGIVGAGGNVGAFLAALLLKAKSAVAESAAISANEALGPETVRAAQAAAASGAVGNGYLWIGIFVMITSLSALFIRFATKEERIRYPRLRTVIAWIGNK